MIFQGGWTPYPPSGSGHVIKGVTVWNFKIICFFWMQTVWHSDGFPKRIFWKVNFWKKKDNKIACKINKHVKSLKTHASVLYKTLKKELSTLTVINNPEYDKNIIFLSKIGSYVLNQDHTDSDMSNNITIRPWKCVSSQIILLKHYHDSTVHGPWIAHLRVIVYKGILKAWLLQKSSYEFW